MIQRLQSILLLVATILSVIVAPVCLVSKGALTDIVSWVGIALLFISGIISFVAIFTYTKRKKQMKLCRIALLTSVLAVVVVAMCAYFVCNTTIAWCFVIIAAFTIILNEWAHRLIRRDEEKVRAADRIR